jgi:hypothetical protein
MDQKLNIVTKDALIYGEFLVAALERATPQGANCETGLIFRTGFFFLRLEGGNSLVSF